MKQVRRALDEGLAAATLNDRDGRFPSQLLHVAIEHRLMHAETLAYMLHQLPFDNKVRKPRLPELVVPRVEPRMIEIPAGSTTLGLVATSCHPAVAGVQIALPDILLKYGASVDASEREGAGAHQG